MADLRIGGMASGMDVESIVKELMTAERMPLQKLQQDQTWLTWQRDAYRETNTSLFELDSLTFDMTLANTFKTKSVSSSDDSLVTATAGSNAANGIHTLENVTAAKAAYNTSTVEISGGTKIDPTKSLWEQRALFSNTDFADEANTDYWQKKSFVQNDIAVSSEKADFKLQKGALDTATLTALSSITVKDGNGGEKAYNIVTDPTVEPGTGEVFVNTNTGELKFGENLSEGSTIVGQSYDHYAFSFSITTYDANGNPIKDSINDDDAFDFEFDGTASLNSVMLDISNSKVGVSAFYDSYTDKVSFQRKETGILNENGAEMQFNGGFLTNVLNLDDTKETAARNASFTIDGLTTSRKSNTFTINGVSYTLKDNIPAGSKVTVSVQNDTDSAFENIKGFIDKYNELIEKVNGKLTEERFRDYKPLTEEQKKAMSESEIEMWEEKAKSGLLRSDNILSSALTQMRQALYSVVETNDEFTHLTDIGISTSPNYQDGGKLVINESKLRKALSENADAVQKIFSNNEDGNSKGVLHRVNDIIDSTMKRIEEKAGKSSHTLQQYSIGRRLDTMNDSIRRFEDRLVKVEDRYWSQFSAMEQAIQRMNQQSAYLMSQFGGM
jgi:flagellar hook-associated protein 2